MRKVPAVLLAVVAFMSMTSAGMASAQDPITLEVRQVDATDTGQVKVVFSYSGERENVGDLVVRQAGKVVDASEAVPLEDQQALGIVLLIDASGSMEENALIERVKEAARTFVAQKAVTDQISVVSFNSAVRVEQDFTADKDLLTSAIDKIALGPATVLYDGIVRSAELFGDRDLQRNVVVFSDGGDSGSIAKASEALGALEGSNAALFAIGVANPGFESLATIARETGGTSGVASDADSVDSVFAGVQSTLRKQYVVDFAATDTRGVVPITLTIGSTQTSAEYVSGSLEAGSSGLRPQVVAAPGGPAFLRGQLGLTLGIGLAVIAGVLVIYALGNIFFSGDKSLTDVLLPYSENYVASADDGDADDDLGKQSSLVSTPVLQRAVDATGRLAQRRGVLSLVETRLEHANLPLRAPEALFFYGASLVIFGIGAVALVGVFGGLFMLVFLALAPVGVVSLLASRRRKAFNSQLPDTLQLLASTLRAGFSLMQGIEAVSQEVAEPMGRELRRVVTEARLGRPLEEALDAVAERTDSVDFGWATMAIRIQREVGGNLSELLVTVGETMTERERLRRDVNSLVAEGKMSAYVLGALPFGLGFFIWISNPGYLSPLFEEKVGNIMLAAAFVWMLFGFFWMKKIIEIDI